MGGFFSGGSSAITPKSIFKAKWYQSGDITLFDATLNQTTWDPSPIINTGDLFTYYHNYESGGYSAVKINRNSFCSFFVQIGSQGSSWGSLTLVTSLMKCPTAPDADGSGITDVVYELPVSASGSLFPTSTGFVRQVFQNEVYSVIFIPSGADITQSEINSLSSWGIVEE
jgi:hypothetical protein